MSDAFTIPFPPSVNAMWRTYRGRMLLSAKGRAYRASVWNALAAWELETGLNITEWMGPVKVAFEVVPPDRRKRDLDNLLKGILDALQHCNVIQDDAQVHSLSIRWATLEPVDKAGGVVVTIGAMP